MRPDEVSGVQGLRAAARSFRLGMEAQGSQALVHLVDWLMRRPDASGDGASATRLEPILGEIVSAQERADFLRVADLLEFELAPLLVEETGGLA